MFGGHRVSAFARLLTVLALLSWSTGLVAAQQPTLTPADYGEWERLGGFQLDPTGGWLVVSISRVDGTRELRLHRASGDGDASVLEHAFAPVFSGNGLWLAYRKVFPRRRRRSPTSASRTVLGLVDLRSATDTVLFDVGAFSFRGDGAWLAAQGVPAADSIGADLIVMNPATGAQTLIGNVDDFAWQDDGELLAATLRTAWGTSNGVILFHPEAGTLRTLDSRDAEYRALTWRGRIRSARGDAVDRVRRPRRRDPRRALMGRCALPWSAAGPRGHGPCRPSGVLPGDRLRGDRLQQRWPDGLHRSEAVGAI